MFAASLLLSGFASVALASPLRDLTSPANLFARSQLLTTTCGTSGTLSCRNTTAVSDLCCFESPGGLLVQPQFWDTAPVTGPTDSWTIHGLWPDRCDGTYDQNCDTSRAYTGLGSLLANNDASDTLAVMNKYWVDLDGDNESFWEHEWSKHGTCMSTFKPSCLPSGASKGAEAVAYFQTTVRLFQSLPTYTWLANAGILPSSSSTWTLSQLTSALKAQSASPSLYTFFQIHNMLILCPQGVTPAFDCTSKAVNQVYWYFYLQGSAIDGKFVLVDAPKSGSCPSSGIKYLPKTATTTTSTPTASTGTAAPTTTGAASGSLSTKGTVKALVNGATTGGLLTAGTWSTQTLATVSFSGTTNSFTMSTSKGNCAISSGALTCGSGITATAFSAISSGGTLLLSYGGSTAFSSDGSPSGTTVYTVYTGSSHTKTYTLSIVSS
ncbi:hypothetical protein D9619_002613 [Psilocybe cf. subviscida]|uniref:Ribonuclease T2-like n=1 Tax=Psilocybe cf. subviscida TaxID=2480587 RepID=A0A8H5AZB6_9AGAR|nr:hypothetical protein D9619_002613 [Psilocybe cf. subviscida]